MNTYSYARLGTFETCPLQYKFRYVDKREVDVGSTIEAFLGTVVRETLERLYALLNSCKIPTLEETVDDYRTRWESSWRDDKRIHCSSSCLEAEFGTKTQIMKERERIDLIIVSSALQKPIASTEREPIRRRKPNGEE